MPHIIRKSNKVTNFEQYDTQNTCLIACPGKVRGDFDPDLTAPNFNLKISVQKDEIGVVTQYSAKWTRIQIPGRPIPDSEPPIWVECGIPAVCLLINEDAQWGTLKFEHDFPLVIDTGVDYAALDELSLDVPGKTIVAIMKALKNNRQKYGFFHSSILKLLEDENEFNACIRTMLDARVGAYKQVLRDDKKSLAWLMSQIPAATTKTPGTGHYLRVSQFEARTRAPEIYTGMTDNALGERGYQHNHPDNERYSCTCYCLARISGHILASNLPYAATKALIFILLNGIYLPEQYQQAQEHMADNTIIDMREVLSLVGNFDECAEVPIVLGEKVFSETGFVPLNRRPAFGASIGLNMGSPIGENSWHAKVPWTLVADTEGSGSAHVTQSYYRPPVKMGYKSINIMQLDAVSEVYPMSLIQFNDDRLSQLPGLPAGTLIQPIFEVVLNEEEAHPFPHCSVPLLNVRQDWNFVRRLGLRLEVEHERKWYQTYIQPGVNTSTYRSGQARSCSSDWHRAMGVIRRLQQHVLVEAEDWHLNTTAANVRQLTVDLYSHIAILTTLVKERLEYSLRITDEDEGELQRKMEDLGFENVNNRNSTGPCDCCLIYWYCKYDSKHIGCRKSDENYKTNWQRKQNHPCSPMVITKEGQPDQTLFTYSRRYRNGFLCSRTEKLEDKLTVEMVNAVTQPPPREPARSWERVKRSTLWRGRVHA